METWTCVMVFPQFRISYSTSRFGSPNFNDLNSNNYMNSPVEVLIRSPKSSWMWFALLLIVCRSSKLLFSWKFEAEGREICCGKVSCRRIEYLRYGRRQDVDASLEHSEVKFCSKTPSTGSHVLFSHARTEVHVRTGARSFLFRMCICKRKGHGHHPLNQNKGRLSCRW